MGKQEQDHEQGEGGGFGGGARVFGRPGVFGEPGRGLCCGSGLAYRHTVYEDDGYQGNSFLILLYSLGLYFACCGLTVLLFYGPKWFTFALVCLSAGVLFLLVAIGITIHRACSTNTPLTNVKVAEASPLVSNASSNDAVLLIPH